MRAGSAGNGPTRRGSHPSTDRRSRSPRPRTAPPRPPIEPRRRHTNLTGRAAILVVALAAVALAVALPFKIWLGQRDDISSLTSQTAQTSRHIAALKAQQQQWNDPSYVEEQARQRLHYVVPGQTTYVVLGGSAATTTPTKTSARAVSSAPWYSQLWSSVASAGNAPSHR